MSFRDKTIKITDWAGNDLFIGDYDDKQVDVVLDKNRCDCIDEHKNDECYNNGVTVCWVDESDKDDCNVYEYINY